MNKYALVIGTGPEWEWDVRQAGFRFNAIGHPFNSDNAPDVMLINDIGILYKGKATYLAGLHANVIINNNKARKCMGLPELIDMFPRKGLMSDILIKPPWIKCTSGIWGAACLLGRGYTHVALAGVPLTGRYQSSRKHFEPHITDLIPVWRRFEGMGGSWEEVDKINNSFYNNVRSVSGNTLKALGDVTESWLRRS